MRTLTLLTLSLFILASCTVEKRVYQKGLNVQWNKRYKADQNQLETSAEVAEIKTSSESTGFVIEQKTQEHTATSQDTRVDVAQHSSVISEVSVSERQVINSSIQNIESTRPSAFGNRSLQKDERRQNREVVKELRSEGKSQIVALILAIVVGLLGVHRFYLGYTGIGVLMILTAGCCGVLALIDIIRIATGNLGPRYEEYSETL